MEKMKIVGVIEIALAIILLAGAIVGGILIPKSVILNVANNLTLDMTVAEIKIIIICSAILLGAISLLMLFDGINKFNFGTK